MHNAPGHGSHIPLRNLAHTCICSRFLRHQPAKQQQLHAGYNRSSAEPRVDSKGKGKDKDKGKGKSKGKGKGKGEGKGTPAMACRAASVAVSASLRALSAAVRVDVNCSREGAVEARCRCLALTLAAIALNKPCVKTAINGAALCDCQGCCDSRP